jgi:AcrR family transcriptional regulator
MANEKNLRVEQAERTRATLVSAARSLFAEKGYFSTGTHEIVERAKVTRGALYHHFPQKSDLFRAVFHAVQSNLLSRSSLEDVAPGSGQQWNSFRGKLARYLEAATQTEVQRILLQDGPAVLGWAEWRQLEAHYGLSSISKALEDGMLSGLVKKQALEPMTLLILSVINEAALFVANAPDPIKATANAIEAINTLLNDVS